MYLQDKSSKGKSKELEEGGKEVIEGRGGISKRCEEDYREDGLGIRYMEVVEEGVNVAT